MDKKFFIKRLVDLRMNKGVSARDMSLSLGQSSGYINNIENGVNLPSMSMFFYICEYLGVSPLEFFDINSTNPNKLKDLINLVKDMPNEKLDLIINMVKAIK